MSADLCSICFEPRHRLAALCARCKTIRNRLDTGAKRRGVKTDRAARQTALAAAWDPTVKAFRCHYGGIVLNHDLEPDPISWTPRHSAIRCRSEGCPGDESDIVVCSAIINDMKLIINDMKSDMTEEEFRLVVPQLAECFAGKRSAIEALKPSR